MPNETYSAWCPRCDREYQEDTWTKAFDKVKEHVKGQHPDHDPQWYDTYPEDRK